MRLLNTKTLCLETFPGHDEIRYAILSHTWGDNEVTFEDICRDSNVAQLKGWDKIRRSCEIATSLDFDYIWIDTCCIDKASSAELSEAINSMFQWYEQAQLCIVFLADVPSSDDVSASTSLFRQSRWFTRGWTLQELIAPHKISFYSQQWELLGTRHSLKTVIRDITGVPEGVLESPSDTVLRIRDRLDDVLVAQKMSWAAERETSRPEDVAYCLLGIFDINMPLIYGEGRAQAFKRLQEEIIRSTGDDSIYAWHCPEELASRKHYWGLLAESPASFGLYEGLTPRRSKYLTRRSSHVTSMSSRGLHVELAVTPFPNDNSGSIFLASLDCEMRWERSSAHLTPAILLQKTSWDNETDFVRIRPDILALSIMNRIVLPDSLVDLARADSESHDIGLQDPIPLQIFVPHSLKATRPPNGMIFHPVIDSPPKVYTIKVRSRSFQWQVLADPSKSVPDGTLSVHFDLSPVPDVRDLKQPVTFGFLELEIEQGGGWNTWATRLIAGVKPLMPNIFGTPPLYFVPWFAFESAQPAAAWEDRQTPEAEARKDHYVMHRTQLLQANIDLESRYSRFFYRISLQVHNPEGETKKSLPNIPNLPTMPWRR